MNMNNIKLPDLTIQTSTAYRKDLKKLSKSDKIVLNAAIQKLQKREKLDPKYHDHKLTGELSNLRDCHVKPDLVLIYSINNSTLILYLIRVGNHNNLQLSSINKVTNKMELNEDITMRDPRDRRKKLKVPQEIEDVINSAEFKRIYDICDRYSQKEGYGRGVEKAYDPQKYCFKYLWSWKHNTYYPDKDGIKEFYRDLGFDDWNIKPNDNQHTFKELKIEGCTVIINITEGFRIYSVSIYDDAIDLIENIQEDDLCESTGITYDSIDNVPDPDKPTGMSDTTYKTMPTKTESFESEVKSNSEKINDFIEDLYDLRKESINKDGEYGLGNLVFKEFRNLGYLDNLKELKNTEKSKELSLED